MLRKVASTTGHTFNLKGILVPTLSIIHLHIFLYPNKFFFFLGGGGVKKRNKFEKKVDLFFCILKGLRRSELRAKVEFFFIDAVP